MTKPTEVSDLLQQLHGTLASNKSLTPQDRELLKRLSADIQAILAQPSGSADAGRATLAARLSDAVTRFEVTHPDLTRVLASVSKSLADMGI